jgi:hypothetical protein
MAVRKERAQEEAAALRAESERKAAIAQQQFREQNGNFLPSGEHKL